MSIWPFESPLEGICCGGPTLDDILRRGTHWCQTPLDFRSSSTPLLADVSPQEYVAQRNCLLLTLWFHDKNLLPVSNGAFSSTGNFASLKGTPQLPIPQCPFEFFARYCW